MRPPRIPHTPRGTLTSGPTPARRLWGHWEMLAEPCWAEPCWAELCQAELCRAEPCRRRGEQEAERGGGGSAQTSPRVRPNQFWRPLPAPPHRPGIRARAAAPGAGGEGAAVGTAASPPAGTAPPCPHPRPVPAPTRCHGARTPATLGHRPRSGASPKVTHSSTWGCATAPPARGTRNTHVAPTVAPTVTPTVAAGAGPGGPRTLRRARLIIRPLPVPVPTSCRLSGSKSMAGQDRCHPHPIPVPAVSLSPSQHPTGTLCSIPAPCPGCAGPGPPAWPEPGVTRGHRDSQGSGGVTLLVGHSRGHGGM